MFRLQGSKIIHSIFIVIFVLYLTVPIQAQYSGGTGEPNNPYQIATAEDLIALGNEPNDYDKHFIMTTDIDLTGYVFEKAVITPIESPYQEPAFNGVFDGNFHTISNLNIHGSQYLGLFGRIYQGEIRNLGIIDVNIPSGQHVGGVAAINKGTILNCYSTGSIKGLTYLGGLVGENAYSGIIKMCYSTCNITVSDNPRGSVGGLVGYNNASITDSYSKGNISGGARLGGLVGINNSKAINRCYSTGQVTGGKSSKFTGGLIGDGSDVNDFSNSFWDIQTSGQTTNDGGTGATTNQMQDPNTFRAAGWDFIGKADGPSNIWAIPENGGYPILWWQLEPLDSLPSFSGGSGSENDPYLIATADDLNDIGYNPRLMDKHFKLTQNINLSNENFYIISNIYYPFEGVFDGNQHKILNFTWTSDGIDGIGFLSFIYYGGLIKNIGIENVDINAGTGDYVGALTGLNQGTIFNSYTTGNILGNGYLGGLVGYNIGILENCFSQTNVAGALSEESNPKGGITGCNEPTGIISKCYSTGYISGYHSGGLAGQDGKSRKITASFWDIETSGQTISYGSASSDGKTTAEMQVESTFTDAGWDFVGETDNGTEDIWTICEGMNYPRFVWQVSEGDYVCPDGINMDDINFFLDYWHDINCDQSNNYCDGTDLDFSGMVDIYDLEILLDLWLNNN